ncbi:MAG: CPXCG motif-containing cysteine-rich protein [Pseudomonadota bacterium]
MQSETFVTANCPYCNAELELHVDCCELEQEYIEDCQHCCQPITVITRINHHGDIELSLRTDSD